MPHDLDRMSPMPPPDLSVVIPAYNEASVIEETLRSLSAHLAASGLDYEIVYDTTPAVEAFSTGRAAILTKCTIKAIAMPKAMGTQVSKRPAPASAAIHARNFSMKAGHAPYPDGAKPPACAGCDRDRPLEIVRFDRHHRSLSH